jgi:hypothetical protein
MMKKKNTVGIERHLIGIPDAAQPFLSKRLIDGSGIDTDEESIVLFRDRIAKRTLEIEAGATKAVSNGPVGMVKDRNLLIPRMVRHTDIDGCDRGFLLEGGRRAGVFLIRKDKVGERRHTVLVASVQQFIAKKVKNRP